MNGSLRLREGPRGWFASFSWRVAISYVVLVLCLLAVQGMMVAFVVARANAQMQGRLPGLPLARAAATVGAALEADSGLSIERALATVTVPAAGSLHVTERHRAQADAAGVTIAVAVDDGADQMTGDPHLLEQAVDHLVVNALRHAPAGSRIVLQATAGDGGVALTVSDSGPGIGPHHAARIFERFYKTEASRQAGNGGSGLGLSIVKAIAERHGGTATVDSVAGRTVFTIRLPHRSVGEDRGPP